jgi:plastocyanin
MKVEARRLCAKSKAATLAKKGAPMRSFVAVFALVVVACSGEKGAAPKAGSPAGASRVGAASTGTTHDVNMQVVKGKFFFSPDTLTIKPGDAVRWHNLGGGPHNVAFKKDKIPAGADAVLNAAMPNRTSSVTGPFLTDSGATYEVSFAGAPAGSYTYSCQPHELLGMIATLTVAP